MELQNIRVRLSQSIRRIQGDLDQRTFAQKLGVSKNKIHRWINGEGEPSATDLAKLALFAHCSIDEIVMGKANAQLTEGDKITDEIAEKVAKKITKNILLQKNVATSAYSNKSTKLNQPMFSDLVRQAISQHGDAKKLSDYLCNSISSERLEELAAGLEPVKEECNILSGILGYSSGELMQLACFHKSNGHR